METDLEYCRRREVDELAQAARARCDASRRCHEELAREYGKLVQLLAEPALSPPPALAAVPCPLPAGPRMSRVSAQL